MPVTGSPAKVPHLSPGKRAVLAALVEFQEVSVLDLADAAQVGRSSAAAALTFLEDHALAARRTLPGSECKGRPSDVWFPTPSAAHALTAEHASEPYENKAAATEPSNDAPDVLAEDDSELAAVDTPVVEPSEASEAMAVPALPPDEASALRNDPPTTAPVSSMPPTGRLGKGVLRDAVRRHLLANPETTFTPTALSKALVKSSGAISNALDVLVAAGDAVLVREKPRTFQASNPVS